jgi:hypothetical protein
MATDVDLVFETHMGELGLLCRPEFRFCVSRKWRADYFIAARPPNPTWCALVEIDGGIWSRGRHVTGKGFLADCEKLNYASALGFKVFRFAPSQVLRGEAKEFIKRWL